MKQRILAVFGLVEIVLRCTLIMNDCQGLMIEPEGGARESQKTPKNIARHAAVRTLLHAEHALSVFSMSCRG
ncbi:hypothetical protein EVAR_66372_1 [Eumeta japonica]|uniref:Secreted protein n=1 Tax=Eumeta variegata TaxID=151549 RepID=A0A4C1ZL27_EUMVA|nr:hypothetical protein EVAR_66372_1 [Eumeta japonica]